MNSDTNLSFIAGFILAAMSAIGGMAIAGVGEPPQPSVRQVFIIDCDTFNHVPDSMIDDPKVRDTIMDIAVACVSGDRAAASVITDIWQAQNEAQP